MQTHKDEHSDTMFDKSFSTPFMTQQVEMITCLCVQLSRSNARGTRPSATCTWRGSSLRRTSKTPKGNAEASQTNLVGSLRQEQTQPHKKRSQKEGVHGTVSREIPEPLICPTLHQEKEKSHEFFTKVWVYEDPARGFQPQYYHSRRKSCLHQFRPYQSQPQSQRPHSHSHRSHRSRQTS